MRNSKRVNSLLENLRTIYNRMIPLVTGDELQPTPEDDALLERLKGYEKRDLEALGQALYEEQVAEFEKRGQL